MLIANIFVPLDKYSWPSNRSQVDQKTLANNLDFFNYSSALLFILINRLLDIYLRVLIAGLKF